MHTDFITKLFSIWEDYSISLMRKEWPQNESMLEKNTEPIYIKSNIFHSLKVYNQVLVFSLFVNERLYSCEISVTRKDDIDLEL